MPFIDDASGLAAFEEALRSGAHGAVLLAHSRPVRRAEHKVQLAVSRGEHVYLDDHQLAGQPVLPLAAALDLVAHAAVEATSQQGAPLLVRDFRLKQPVRIPDAAQFTVSVSGERELAVASAGVHRLCHAGRRGRDCARLGPSRSGGFGDGRPADVVGRIL